MKRVVIDARKSGTSTGRYVDKLLEYLPLLDSGFDLIVLAKPQRIEYLKSVSPIYRIVECTADEFTFAEQVTLKKIVEGLESDLVHFTMVQQPVFYLGRVVTTMQDLTTIRFRNPAKNWLIFTVKHWVYIWVNKRVARKSVHLITPTEFVKNDVAEYTGVSPEKITFTHEAVDSFDDKPEPVPGFENKTFIMSDGRPRPHKNTQRVIEAFAMIHKDYPSVHLMLTGRRDASFAPYQKLIDSLGLHDLVTQTDYIPDGQLMWAMAHTKAYVWASLSEGFGLPPLEAMLNGAPVASSSASCMPEVLGDAAHYFDPLDVDDMAAKISDLLGDKKLRDELIAKGHQQVKKYSWRRMAEQTLEVYKNALGE